MGVVPGVLADNGSYPALAAELDLDCVHAVQNDELGLLDVYYVVALGDEMVLKRVEERTQRHRLTVPERERDMSEKR